MAPIALRQIFTCLSTPGPHTCFEGIQLLPPSHYLVINDVGKDATVTEKAYWELDFPDAGSEVDTDQPEKLVNRLDELLQQAVKRRLQADVPVVAYQSGGVDSSIITAIANRQLGYPIPSYTIRMDSPELDESKEAGNVARHIGSDPHFLTYGAAQMFATYPRLIHAAEYPVIDTSCASLLLLAEKVHQDGYKVVLTGEGSDEWFAGYPWYKIHRMVNWLDAIPGIPGSDWLRCIWRGMLQLGGARVFPRSMELHDYQAGGGMNAWMDFYTQLGLNKLRFMTPQMLEGATPYELEDLPLPFERMWKWHPLNRGLAWGIRLQLAGMLLQAKGDRIAMNSSVETRYPFLDEDVFDFTATLHPRWKLRGFHDKYLLRNVAERYLPHSIAQRRKVIFRGRFDSFFTQPNPPAYVEQLLSPESIRKAGYFEYEAVHKMIKYIQTGFRMPGPRLMIEMGLVGVLATQLWHHYFIDSSLADLPAYDFPQRLVA
ncbi:MAG: asparagine synthase C-terminal domain-containing protein [Gemmatales bacterium]